MNKFFGWAAIMLLLGAAPFMAQNPGQKESDQGKALFQNKCAFCHGLKGDGKGPAAEPLLGHPVDFTEAKFWKEDPELKIEETVTKGKEMMPAFNLAPEEIKAIIRYMTETFKKPAGENGGWEQAR